jgi:hypothetical protein
VSEEWRIHPQHWILGKQGSVSVVLYLITHLVHLFGGQYSDKIVDEALLHGQIQNIVNICVHRELSQVSFISPPTV